MPDPIITRRGDSGGAVSSEVNAFIQELVKMNLGFTITSSKREKASPGSRHLTYDAIDIGVKSNDDASMLKFFFGEDFDPTDYSNMGKLKMTPEGLAFCKRHNIRIIDERDGKYGPHFHIEVITEDRADKVVESEDEATYHTEGRSIQISGRTAYEYGLEVTKDNFIYVKNDYNKSEEYQNSVNDGPIVDLRDMTPGGGSSGEVEWINNNEEILNYDTEKENIEEEESKELKIFKNDEEVLDAMARGEISSTDVIRIEYDGSNPKKPKGEVYEGTVKMGMDSNDNEFVQFLDGVHTNAKGDTNTHEGGSIVKTTPKEEIETEEIKTEEIKSFDSLGDVPAGLEDQNIIVNGIKYYKSEDGTEWIEEPGPDNMTQEDIENYQEQIKEEEVPTYKGTNEVYDSIMKGDIKGDDIIRIEFNDGSIYEGTVDYEYAEPGEPINLKFSNGTHTDKEGSVNKYEDGLTIEKNHNLKAEDYVEEYIDKEKEIETPETTEVPEVTETPEITTGGEEIPKASIYDDKETIRKRLISEGYEGEELESEIQATLEWNEIEKEWVQDNIIDNKEIIDKIFAENPELAEKFKDIDPEYYSEVDEFYYINDEEGGLNELIKSTKEGILNDEREFNKTETGLPETNEERTEREDNIKRYDDLITKRDNEGLSAEEEVELQNIIDNHGGYNPSELYEEHKKEEAERDANEEAGHGRITNWELENKIIEEEELQQEREDNYKITGISETDEEKFNRFEREKEQNQEDGFGYITNVQKEDQDVIWSTSDSEKELRNELKKELDKEEASLRAAAGDKEAEDRIKEDIKVTKLALEYLELKNKHGRKDDVFDIKSFREAIKNKDVQQLNMWYNDQRKEVIHLLEKDRKSIEDGTYTGSEEEREYVLSTLETLKKSSPKSELPDFDNQTHMLKYVTLGSEEDFTKLEGLQKDRKYIKESADINGKIINAANSDKTGSGITTENKYGDRDYQEVIDWNNGTTYYIKVDWLNTSESSRAVELREKQNKGTITSEELIELNKLSKDFHRRDVRTRGNLYMNTEHHPDGVTVHYSEGLNDIDKFIANRKDQIIKAGLNPDINLTAEQIALLNKIQQPDYDNANLQNDLDAIISYSPEVFDVDYTPEETDEDKELRSQGLTGQQILQGTIEAAKGVVDAFGGPDALINAVMGKKALAAAMKDVTPMEQAKLSPMFMEHLRETRELSKRGYHPAEELKIRREIDRAYQTGLENTIRGTAGDRAKYLAASGIFDAKRTLALLEVAEQDAVLQRENQKQYSDLLLYKENFEATQQENKRTENLQMQLANKKAASEFAGLTFANVMSGLNNSSSLIDKLKQGMMNNYNGGFNLSSVYENNNTNNEENQ